MTKKYAKKHKKWQKSYFLGYFICIIEKKVLPLRAFCIEI